MTAKKLPVGIENFEEIRKQDFYYVDKTGLIVDLLASWALETPMRPSSFLSWVSACRCAFICM